MGWSGNERRGYGRAYAVTSNTNIKIIDLHYWDLKYGRIQGMGDILFWYYWPSMTTFADSPYYVNKINNHEFYARR